MSDWDASESQPFVPNTGSSSRSLLSRISDVFEPNVRPMSPLSGDDGPRDLNREVADAVLRRARSLALVQGWVAGGALVLGLLVSTGSFILAILAAVGARHVTRLMQSALDPEELSERMRELPPTFLRINTGTSPLTQVLEVLGLMRDFGATEMGLFRPQLLVTGSDPAQMRSTTPAGGAPASLKAERSFERASGSEATDPLHFVRLKLRQAVNASPSAWEDSASHERRRGSFGSEDEEIREFITVNFSIESADRDCSEKLRQNIGLLTRRFSKRVVPSSGGGGDPDSFHGAQLGVAVLAEDPLDDSHRAHVQSILERSGEWGFNALSLVEPTNNHGLLFLGYWLFVKERLPSLFNIPHSTLLNFLTNLEAAYRDVPYHNRNHAADVLHASCHMLQSLRRGIDRQRQESHRPDGSAPIEGVRPVDALALILAAAAHDMDHTGANNAYHVATSSELALRYNDRSVLESHHCSRLFQLLGRSECNILANLSVAQRKEVRDAVVAMILGTDMAFHFVKVDKFKSMREAGDLDCSKPDVRTFVLEMLLHCADIANPTRPEATYRQWIPRVMEEFFQQGDLERDNGLPVTKFFDRTCSNVPKCQMGFINVIVSPLVEAFADFIDLPEMAAHLGHNRAVMEKEAVAAELERVAQLKADGALSDDELASAKAAILAGKPSPF